MSFYGGLQRVGDLRVVEDRLKRVSMFCPRCLEQEQVMDLLELDYLRCRALWQVRVVVYQLGGLDRALRFILEHTHPPAN